MSDRILIDTHMLIWILTDDNRLPARYRAMVLQNLPLLVSIASLWEMQIKVSLGKLEIADHLVDTLDETYIAILPVERHHVRTLRDLPLHHRDPFDRMLIAQAKAEGLTVMTVDPEFRSYDIQLA